MSSVQDRREPSMDTPGRETIDVKLEVVVIPVSDVDRAKDFYGHLGSRLDADVARGEDFRLVQFTPPGSGRSIQFGTNLTSATPGSAQGLYLIVSDVEAAHGELVALGVDVSEVFHVTYTDPQAAAVGATEAEFSATAQLSEVAKTATYTHAYAESNGFLTLLSDGERITGAYALGPEAGEWRSR